MTKFQTLMLSTLIAGGLALPASALTLGADTGLSVSIGTEAGVKANANASAKAGTNAAANASTTAKTHAADTSAVVAATLEADTDSTFLNNEVLTKDGVKIGSVEKVWVDADGNNHVQVKLADASGKSFDAFTIEVGANMTADGALKLGWTEAELMAALEADAKAKAQSKG